MKKIVVLALSVLALGVAAMATPVACTVPLQFANGNSAPVSVFCSIVVPNGQVLSSATLFYNADYQFGTGPGNAGQEMVQVTFAALASGPVTGWNLGTTVLTVTGAPGTPASPSSSSGVQSGSALALGLPVAGPQNFSIQVNVSSLTGVGTTVATSSANVLIDYTTTTPGGVPEPATFGMVGSALVGLGFLARRRKK
jgi:hypothetical protein